ncbi:transcription elongation factor GreA [bacterium]|nr:transcription elongation factor GreA [bacterium]MCI0565966.1 transcription elongation factor GreA [bacterium]MCI0680032.1 transcription elongation factor GreA [bacterium]
MDEKQYLSKEKHAELTAELDTLKNAKRKQIAEQLEFAKSLGDLAENAEYHEARAEQATVEDRIAVLEDILQNAVIVSAEGHRGDLISIGSRVVVKKKDATGTREYVLVGSEESDMAEGKLSNTSPLGKALMGAKKGDIVVSKTPTGKVEYQVVEVK